MMMIDFDEKFFVRYADLTSFFFSTAPPPLE